MPDDVKKSILSDKIIAIIRNVRSEQIEQVAEALLKGNIRCLELALSGGANYDEKDVLNSIERIRKKYDGQIYVGAGTILTVEQMKSAYNSGAQYMISPNVNPDVIAQTKQCGCISIPGAYSPTEIINAYEYGADLVKVFPVGKAGASYIKNLSVPLGKIPLIAVGGVTLQNVQEFLHAGAVAVGVGGNLVDIQLIQQKRYSELAVKAKEFHRLISWKVDK